MHMGEVQGKSHFQDVDLDFLQETLENKYLDSVTQQLQRFSCKQASCDLLNPTLIQTLSKRLISPLNSSIKTLINVAKSFKKAFSDAKKEIDLRIIREDELLKKIDAFEKNEKNLLDKYEYYEEILKKYQQKIDDQSDTVNQLIEKVENINREDNTRASNCPQLAITTFQQSSNKTKFFERRHNDDN